MNEDNKLMEIDAVELFVMACKHQNAGSVCVYL